MTEAYIVEAVRTAGGRRNGRLAGWHPAELGVERCCQRDDSSNDFRRLS